METKGQPHSLDCPWGVLCRHSGAVPPCLRLIERSSLIHALSKPFPHRAPARDLGPHLARDSSPEGRFHLVWVAETGITIFQKAPLTILIGSENQ